VDLPTLIEEGDIIAIWSVLRAKYNEQGVFSTMYLKYKFYKIVLLPGETVFQFLNRREEQLEIFRQIDLELSTDDLIFSLLAGIEDEPSLQDFLRPYYSKVTPLPTTHEGLKTALIDFCTALEQLNKTELRGRVAKSKVFSPEQVIGATSAAPLPQCDICSKTNHKTWLCFKIPKKDRDHIEKVIAKAKVTPSRRIHTVGKFSEEDDGQLRENCIIFFKTLTAERIFRKQKNDDL
jgi:hypothetical protein